MRQRGTGMKRSEMVRPRTLAEAGLTRLGVMKTTMKTKRGRRGATPSRTGRASLRRGVAALAAACLALTLADAGAAQEVEVAGSAVSIASQPGGRATLELELADGSGHVITFADGAVRVDRRRIGSYQTGGALESAWREFLRAQIGREGQELAEALGGWRPPELTGEEAQTAAALRERIDRILAVPEPEAAPAETVAGPGGAPLSIAPGGISFQELSRQLESLRASLEGLGEAAEGADERLALIIHDDFTVAEGRTVDGNLALLGGDLGLAGLVRGDVLVLDGTLRLLSSGRVEGDLLQVGGSVEHEGGRVSGELLSLRPVDPSVAPRAPATARDRQRSVESRATTRVERRRERGFVSRTARNFGRAIEGLIASGSAYLALGLLGLLAVYLARPQMETVADATRRRFGRSFALGFAGQVLFAPAVLVLVVLVVTWLVLPFFVLGVIAAVLGGYLAVAHAAGELFARRRYRYEWLERLRRSNSYYYVLVGLALLLLPFALASLLWVFGGLAGFLRGLLLFVAVAGTWVLATTGFGAVLLTRGGTRAEFARPEDWSAPATGPETSGGAGG